MTPLSIPCAPGAFAGRPLDLVRRLVARLAERSIRELDARTLADIGASQTLRAQADLREAWRQAAGTSRWHSL